MSTRPVLSDTPKPPVSPQDYYHVGPRRTSGIFTRPVVVSLFVVGLVTIGTVGFRIIEGWPWFQCLYGTLMTVSTIGAEPVNRLSQAGRVFNVVLIFLGVGVVGFAMATLTHVVIESELGLIFGRRRMEKEISRLKDHVIVCGVGRVGRRVAAEVAARNLPLVVIEDDSTRAKWAQDNGFPVIIGDATSEAVLRQARIEHARGLASAVTSDAQNVYVVLTARSMMPELPIVARASEEAAESKLLRAGATAVICPYTHAGYRMARTLTRPNVQRFIDLALSSLTDADLDLQIEEICVGDGSKLAGSQVGEADIRGRLGVILLAIRRAGGRLDFNPAPEQTISPGDCLIAMGDSQKLKQLESLAGV